MITLRSPSGDKAAGAITLRRPVGDKAIAQMVLRTPSGDKQIYSATNGGLTIETSPFSARGSVASAGSADVTTNAVTAQVTGGTPPYSYAWAFETGDTGWSILSPAAQTTRFRIEADAGETKEGTFELTVTDARGRVGTAMVTANAFNFGSLGIL